MPLYGNAKNRTGVNMSSISINDLLAMRSAILDRNAALRNVASSAGSVGSPGGAGAKFEAAMDTVLGKADGADSLAGPGSNQRILGTERTEPGGFTSTLQTQLQKINDINARAGQLTVAYERGEEVDIAKVMLARQESSIAFEATLQVRNRLLSAYKDIMSMPV
ncbi:flagellar hook-basal body complex protein FliE [Sphingobium xenophagum]|jgi:flagellar hook-basal body complex protein FliE|uniref:Flagellar hook-basal body complex protein FliE n=2 Tax=Sphingobium TaxID=165695 RepID=A0A401J522_SPHXE|nr:flagellar hook-basal body complex protein FliE [Sphingobium xenophagum]|tara:strand:+ start:4142 stop:4633 length:492 start_codon:yes stop_codon:yes gene_type:complete